jgi:hypothetical protein
MRQSGSKFIVLASDAPRANENALELFPVNDVSEWAPLTAARRLNPSDRAAQCRRLMSVRKTGQQSSQNGNGQLLTTTEVKVDSLLQCLVRGLLTALLHTVIMSHSTLDTQSSKA